MPRVLVNKDNAYVGMKVEPASTWSWGSKELYWKEGVTAVIERIGDDDCTIAFTNGRVSNWYCRYNVDLIVAEQVFQTDEVMRCFHKKLVQLGTGHRTGYVRDLANYTIGTLIESVFDPLAASGIAPRNYLINFTELGPLWYVPDYLYTHLMSQVSMDADVIVTEPATTDLVEAAYEPPWPNESLIKNPIQQDGKKSNGSIVEVSTEAPAISTGKGRYPSTVQSPGSAPAVSVGHLSNRTIAGQGRI